MRIPLFHGLLPLVWNCIKSSHVTVVSIRIHSPEPKHAHVQQQLSQPWYVWKGVRSADAMWEWVRGQTGGRGEFTVLWCYYQSLIAIIMQVQAAMFWWPLTLSAYLIRLVTAAEEWKSEKCWATPRLSRQHHSHLCNISLSIINATFQISPISQSCNSWTLFMHARWRGPFRDTV